MNSSTILGVIFTILASIILSMCSQIESLKEEISIVENNNKAYQAELSDERGKCNVYKLTIDQLNYFNDSITNKLKEAKEELKIKDKNIQQLQYIKSTMNKVDTIVVRDTIFKKDLALDTCIGDKWYNINLIMKYPDTLVVNPKFINENIVLIHSKKEYVKPPKKWWWQRLFQKKHTVVTVDIKQNNPYIETEEQKFIEIIK